MRDEKPRCDWAKNDLSIKYHDTEWGVPTFDDKRLFEFLILEGAQAGLAWETILRKRENYRIAFDNFDAEKIARYDDRKIVELMQNTGIVRNRLKIAATVQNAKCYLKIVDEFGNFNSYIWRFVNGVPVKNVRENTEQVPATTPESDRMSVDFIQRGFNFVGSTICCAFMQACGLVNDHLVSCFRYEEV